jgi:hypothetical protein
MLVATDSKGQTHREDWGSDQRTASSGSRPLSGYIREPRKRFLVSRSVRSLASALSLVAVAVGFGWSPHRLCAQGPKRAELLMDTRAARPSGHQRCAPSRRKPQAGTCLRAGAVN